MAVISVKRKPGTRRRQIPEVGEVVFEQTYYVSTDTPGDDVTVIENAPGLPKMFDVFVTPEGVVVPYMFVVAVEPQETETPYHWEVKVRYSSEPRTLFEDPLSRPPVVTWSTERIQRVIWDDQAGNAIVNSANEVFDPLPTIDRRLLVVNYTTNKLPGDLDYKRIADDFLDHVNDAEWMTFPEKSVKFDDFRTNTFTERYIEYVSATYVFKIDTEYLWKFRAVDIGYNHLEGGLLVRNVAPDGQIYSNPQLLNGAGALLSNGATPIDLEFDIHPTADFSWLNITDIGVPL